MPPAKSPASSGTKATETVALRDYIEARLDAMEKHIEARLDAMDKATSVAYQSMERRLDGMNEFRETLRDQTQSFATKAEYCQFKDRTEDDIRMLRESRALLEGKASQSAVNTLMLISVVSLLIGMTSLVLRFLGV